MPPMAHVYSYMRFSNPSQQHGDSLRRQTSGTMEFVKAGSHTLAELTLKDLGVSAFRGKNATSGALAKFLDAVNSGRVPKGSILAVENLDRLSRDQVTPALNLFLSIISAGVTIATLMDGKTYSVATVNANPMDLMFSILILMRAHEESRTKSKRSLANWEQKRVKARDDQQPATSLCPTWLRLDTDAMKYVPIPDHVATLRRIVAMVKDGHGVNAITRRFNKEHVPTFSRKGTKLWEASTVRHLTLTRALLGEYQPYKMVDGVYQPDGDPIPDYYPTVISEADYYAMQSCISTRRIKTKGSTGKLNNLFGAILSDETGCRLVVNYKMNYGKGQRYRPYLSSADSVKGAVPALSFPYQPFEDAFLSWVIELDLSKLDDSDPSDRLTELRGRLAEIKDKVQRTHAAILSAGGGKFDSLLGVIAGLEKRQHEVEEQIEHAAEVRHGTKVSKRDIVGLIREMKTAEEDARIDVRRKLRSLILSIVRSITLHVRHSGMVRLAVARVCFEDGTERLFAVRVERGRDEQTFSDSVVYNGGSDAAAAFNATHAADVADSMITARSVDGMRTAWQGHVDQPRRRGKAAPVTKVMLAKGRGRRRVKQTA